MDQVTALQSGSACAFLIDAPTPRDLPAKLLRYCSQTCLNKNVGLVSRLDRLEKLSAEADGVVGLTPDFSGDEFCGGQH